MERVHAIKEKNVQKKYKILFLKELKSILNIRKLEKEIISFESLTDPMVVKKLQKNAKKWKNIFSSSKLTSLHSNATDKQSFPGVNIVRQILRELGYKMIPIVKSNGYHGKKKLVKRYYLITRSHSSMS